MTLISLTLLAALLTAWCVRAELDRRERQLERRNLRRLLNWLNQ